MITKADLFVKYVLICEDVKEEGGGKLTFVKMYDGITIDSNSLGDELVAIRPLTFVVGIYTTVEESYLVDVEFKHPNGKTLNLGSFPMGYIDGRQRGTGFTTLNFQFETEGLHWINLYCQGEIISQYPFEVAFRAQPTFLYDSDRE